MHEQITSHLKELTCDEVEVYLKFIEQRLPNTKGHQHHILPKCLFPEYASFYKNPWNRVRLTIKEHIKAHKLLTRIFPDNFSLKIAYCVMSGDKHWGEAGVWYTNGRDEVYILPHTNIPDGYVNGRIATPNTKGYIWVTNGVKNRSILPWELRECVNQGYSRGMTTNRKPQPDKCIITNGITQLRVPIEDFTPSNYPGFVRGLLHQNIEKLRGRSYIWANNGQTQLQLGLEELLPEGYIQGKLKDTRARRPYPVGKKWYQNGKTSVQIYPGQPVPEGFTPGRLKKPLC